MRATTLSLTLVALCALLTPAVRGQLVTDNKVEAIVNKTVITSYDVYQAIKKKEVDLKAQPKSEQELIYASFLKDLIRQAVRDQAAEKSGVAVSPEELENRKLRAIEQMGGEAAFEGFLRQTGQSIEQYNTEFQKSQEQAAWLRVVSGRGGARLSRELRPLYDITVRPAEMRAIYKKRLATDFTTRNEARLRVIQVYFRRNKRGDRRAKKRILQGLKQKLKTKADFAVLARRHSEHSTKKNGGLLESVELGKGALIPESIEKLVFSDKTAPGTILGPIEDVNSFWLVKVEDKKKARVIPFSEAQAGIRNVRMRQKIFRAITEVELDLVKKAYIYPPSLKRIITRDLESALVRARQ